MTNSPPAAMHFHPSFDANHPPNFRDGGTRIGARGRPRFSLALLSLVVGLGLLAGGCGSSAPTTASPEFPDRFPNHTVEQIRGEILHASDTLRSFSGKARITVQSPEQTQTFNAVVRQRRADSLFMRFSKLGFEGGRLLLTQDSVFFFDTRKAVLRVGSVEEVQEIVPVPVSSDQLFLNMLGLIAPSASGAWSLQSDSSFYYLSGRATDERYVVDPTRWRVVRYVEKSSTGTVQRKRLFSDFEPVEGLQVPRRVEFRRPANSLKAVISYQTMTFNPTRLSLSIDVPSQVPRRPFR